MAGFVDERTADIVCLDYNKAFDTVLHKILKEKLMKYGMDEQTERWTEKWLNSQRLVISDMESRWRSVTSSVPRDKYWIQSSSTLSVMIWMIEQSVPSASLLMTPD
ncbi:rna-directed dna polymerase from mobile element jockey- hypothetical protein [Limosa lapponica baueri]|uniref:Reverse transcriptase domain-containing protein n=1 Tax=Limosa lapponica baueri TaxID=1758121 RepID=A0A2I0U9R6_LIMLA|nr:rna-directed dna polymerase from mobile element jockey- hypothetical protein [Limosa lapponica baueri]